MGSLGWFLLGGAAVYLACNSGKGGAGVGGGLNLSIGGGAGASGLSYRGAQRPAPYDPLGTVGGFPGPSFGEGAYIDGASGGALPYSSKAPSNLGYVETYGANTLPTGSCPGGC